MWLARRGVVHGLSSPPPQTLSPTRALVRLRPAYHWGVVGLMTICMGTGATLLVFVYRWAQSAPPNYDLFWVGMASMFVPLWLVALSRSLERIVLPSIVLAGICSYLPAFLRAPTRPVFGDALGHYLSVENTIRTGNLFAPNPIVPVAADYPGLHALTAALVKLTGASIWDIAVTLIPLLHISTLLGIYTITFALSNNKRASAVAAIIYGVSPQFQFFDSQFAYESLAVPLLIWVIALVLHAQKSKDTRYSLVLLVTSTILGGCCVVTHHVTSYVLASTLVLIGLSQLALGERRRARSSLGVGLMVSLFAIGWVILTKAPVVSYLDYFPRTAFNAIGPIFHKLLGERTSPSTSAIGPTATATRSLFAGSTLPLYEHYAAYGVQVLAFVATAAAAWRLWHWRSGALLAFIFLAGTYFLLLPLRLNLAGEQGAGRVSTYQWIGIAIVIAVGLVAEAPRGSVGLHSRKRSRSSRKRLPYSPWTPAIATAVMFVSLVGNYGSSVDAGFQFPGVFQLGSSDGRDTPLEAVTLAERFLAVEGPGRTIMSDGATLRIFETYAYAQPTAVPQWEFYLAEYFSSRQLQSLAYSGHIYAIVVDDRVIENSTALGFPANFVTPITTKDLDRLASFKWLQVMFRTTHYTVLKVLGSPNGG